MRVVKSWLPDMGDRKLPLEKNVFLDSGGLRIRAVLDAGRCMEGKPAAVLVHGFQSDADELAGLAAALAAYGWAAMRLDLRGNGLSEGHRDDINGYVRDTMRAIDYLIAGGVNRRKVFVVGQSLGGAVAITCAAADPRVAGVVALHPSCEYDLGAYHPPVGHLDVRCPLRSVKLLPPRPLLIIAGERDHVLPCSRAHALYAAARRPKRMLEVKDGTHATEDTEAYALGWLLAGAPHV